MKQNRQYCHIISSGHFQFDANIFDISLYRTSLICMTYLYSIYLSRCASEKKRLTKPFISLPKANCAEAFANAGTPAIVAYSLSSFSETIILSAYKQTKFIIHSTLLLKQPIIHVQGMRNVCRTLPITKNELNSTSRNVYNTFLTTGKTYGFPWSSR